MSDAIVLCEICAYKIKVGDEIAIDTDTNRVWHGACFDGSET